jgi:hypothetical protein
MFAICAQVLPFLVPDAAQNYPDRRDCVSGSVRTPEDRTIHPSLEFYSDFRQEISDVSGGEETFTPRRPPQKKFLRVSPSCKSPTWVSCANQGGISVRTAVSSSITIALSTIEWLFNWHYQKGLHSKCIEMFAGVIFLPTYIRSDYHTLGETAAGLKHYLSSRRDSDQDEAVLSPKDALAEGLRVMNLALDPKYQKEFEIISSKIIHSARHVSYEKI